jgi:hypothetical protein
MPIISGVPLHALALAIAIGPGAISNEYIEFVIVTLLRIPQGFLETYWKHLNVILHVARAPGLYVLP